MVGDDLIPDGGKDSSFFSSQPHNATYLKEWSMVLIRDSPAHGDCSVFPPVNHENLHIPSHSQPCEEQQNPLSPSSSSSTSPSLSSSSSFTLSSSLSPSDSFDSDSLPAPPSDSRVKKAGEVTSWIGIGLEVFRCKVVAVVSSFRNYVAYNRGAFRSFGPVAAVVALVVWTLFMRYRRRRRRAETVGRLVQIIKEKDEKITQLLHQIAQMNEVLLARHRDL
ncbi:hypothetical protein FH972_019277 [Carpinus fangiana]|uniref:Transmembrane protein n=1 Tax=Carpinus fangiana TaxID=176857 RepID=A0A5N6RT61_9ROSI|nr:hypothetical protein FH972_019277 [Carpinus fangiana]